MDPNYALASEALRHLPSYAVDAYFPRGEQQGKDLKSDATSAMKQNVFAHVYDRDWSILREPGNMHTFLKLAQVQCPLFHQQVMENMDDFREMDLHPNYSRIAAPVPLARPNPTGYSGFTYMIDGSVQPRVWSCNCGPSPSATPYGIKDAENAIVDPTRAYYSEVNCSGQPTTCVDPRATTYLNDGRPSDHLSCVYATAISRQECTDSRVPEQGCFRYPFRTSVD